MNATWKVSSTMETTEDKNKLKTIEPHVAQIIQQFATDAKNLLKEQVIAEYLFGSYATNTQTSLSDIDILILVNQYTPELQWQMSGLASDYSLKYDLCFSPILQDLQVWKKNQQAQTLFYQEITKHGIRL